MTGRRGSHFGGIVAGVALVGVGIGLLIWMVRTAPPREREVAASVEPDASGSEATPVRARALVPAAAPAAAPHSAPGAARAVVPAPRVDRTDESADERTAMARIRASVRSDPDGALALIDAADRAHPSGAFAEERAALRVDALVFAQRIGIARDAAEEFLRRYPRSDRAQHIEMLTGVHPHPPDD